MELLIFVCEVDTNFIILHVDIQLLKHHLLKTLSFLHWLVFVEN